MVATALSVVDRRGDTRDDQRGRVDQASTLAGVAIRGSVSRLRQNVYVNADAAIRSADSDDRALAQELVRFFLGAEACIGITAAGCTGADLFALDQVADLATKSGQLDDGDGGRLDDALATLALLATDARSDSVYAVRRVTTESTTRTVAVRVPVDQLLDDVTRSKHSTLES
ncbi:MAG: hypothetical protein ACI8V4_002350 [Ilumatobacter sp.]